MANAVVLWVLVYFCVTSVNTKDIYLMYKYNIHVFAWHGQLSHVMDLIENNCKTACELTDQQRANFASLQDVCNIRDNVLYSYLQIHEVNVLIYDIVQR